MSTGRLRRLLPLLIAVVVLGAVTAYQVLPAPGHLGDRFSTNTGDPVFLMWQLDWQAHHPLSAMQGNIFFPHGDAMAYSDPLLGYLPLTAPVLAITGDNVVAAYNMLLFAGYLLGALAVYALVQRLTGHHGAALVASLLFTLSPYHTAAMLHPQLVAFAWLPVALLLLMRLLTRRGLGAAAGLGAVVGIVWLSALYVAEMTVITLAVVAVVWAVRNRGALDRDGWRRLGCRLLTAAVIAAVVSLPTLPAYVRVQHSGVITRTAAELIVARPSGFVHPPPSLLYRHLPVTTTMSDTLGLYPGVLLVVLAALGVGIGVARRRAGRPLPPWSVELGAAAVVAAGAMAGSGRSLPVSLLYRGLAAAVPGMHSLRDLTRFWLVPLLVLAVAAGCGVAWLTSRLAARRHLLACALVAALCAAGVVELGWRWSYTSVTTDSTSDALLLDLPSAPVMELPMSDPSQPGWAYVTAPRMLRSVPDAMPRVEGYSGAVPPDVRDLMLLAEHIPDASALAVLRAAGVRYLVVHVQAVACAGAYDAGEAASLLAALAADSGDVERVVMPERAGEDPVVVLRAPAAIERVLRRPAGAVPRDLPACPEGT